MPLPLFVEVEALLDDGMSFEEVDKELGMKPGFTAGLFSAPVSRFPLVELVGNDVVLVELLCTKCAKHPSLGAQLGPFRGLCDGCTAAKRKEISKIATDVWEEKRRQAEKPTIPAFERIFGEGTERSRRLLATLEEFREADDDLDSRLDARAGMSRPAPDSRQIVYSFAGKAKRVAAALAEQQDLAWWELTDHQREGYVELAIRVLEAVEAVEAAETQVRSSLHRRDRPL